MTQVVMLRPNTWTAIWRGQTSPISFNSRGAALAYLATCHRLLRHIRQGTVSPAQYAGSGIPLITKNAAKVSEP
jgi:hypothetical protein